MHVQIENRHGELIDCYGEVRDDSNFSVVCDDEEDDFICCGFVNPPTTWKEVVKRLEANWDGNIQQIEAI